MNIEKEDILTMPVILKNVPLFSFLISLIIPILTIVYKFTTLSDTKVGFMLSSVVIDWGDIAESSSVTQRFDSLASTNLILFIIIEICFIGATLCLFSNKRKLSSITTIIGILFYSLFVLRYLVVFTLEGYTETSLTETATIHVEMGIGLILLLITFVGAIISLFIKYPQKDVINI